MSTTPAPEIIEGPAPPPPPTPLDPPRVYFSTRERQPPRVVFTKESADEIDPQYWTWLPLPQTAPAEKSQWPKLYYNVNVSPRVVSEEEAGTLGPEWQEFQLPEALIRARTP